MKSSRIARDLACSCHVRETKNSFHVSVPRSCRVTMSQKSHLFWHNFLQCRVAIPLGWPQSPHFRATVTVSKLLFTNHPHAAEAQAQNPKASSSLSAPSCPLFLSNPARLLTSTGHHCLQVHSSSMGEKRILKPTTASLSCSQFVLVCAYIV